METMEQAAVYAASTKERTASAIAAGLVVALIGLMLVLGLRPGQLARVPAALVSVVFDEPVHPREKEIVRPTRRERESAAKGAPSPRNLKNKATQVVAPPVPLPPLSPPPPIVTAPVAGIGAAANNGASLLPGPGQGAGGIGNGLGGGGTGGEGNGDGGGGSPPRQIKGKLSFSDMPEGTVRPGSEAAVGVRYRVNVDGRVSDCRIDQTSGFPSLDATACRLIEERFRFRPARDRAGRPVSSVIVETHGWVIPPDDK